MSRTRLSSCSNQTPSRRVKTISKKYWRLTLSLCASSTCSDPVAKHCVTCFILVQSRFRSVCTDENSVIANQERMDRYVCHHQIWDLSPKPEILPYTSRFFRAESSKIEEPLCIHGLTISRTWTAFSPYDKQTDQCSQSSYNTCNHETLRHGVLASDLCPVDRVVARIEFRYLFDSIPRCVYVSEFCWERVGSPITVANILFHFAHGMINRSATSAKLICSVFTRCDRAGVPKFVFQAKPVFVLVVCFSSTGIKLLSNKSNSAADMRIGDFSEGDERNPWRISYWKKQSSEYRSVVHTGPGVLHCVLIRPLLKVTTAVLSDVDIEVGTILSRTSSRSSATTESTVNTTELRHGTRTYGVDEKWHGVRGTDLKRK